MSLAPRPGIIFKHSSGDHKIRRLSPLLLIEMLAVGVWVALSVSVIANRSTESGLQPIDPAVLTEGAASEEWFGIYFQDQKVGYAVNSRAPIDGGGTLVQHRSAFRMAAFGEIKEVVVAASAVLSTGAQVQRFDFFTSSDPVRLAVRGEVLETELVVELHQAGEIQTVRLPIDAPPQMSASLSQWVATQEEISEGSVFQTPYFDPVTLAQATMDIRVVGTELLSNGEEAYWLEREFAGATTRTLVTPAGDVLREEGALGMAMVRQTAQEARTLPTGAAPVDIIALSAVPLTGKLHRPRKVERLALRIGGVDPDRIMNDGPVQSRSGDVVRTQSPVWSSIPDVPVIDRDPATEEHRAATPFLPIGDRRLVEQAEKIVSALPTRRAAVKALVDWVHGYLVKAPTVGVPNALEVLEVGQGDCNEHTALFVGLARAAGISSRIAAGVVYSNRVTPQGSFYYHAWPEVYFGPEGGWVPVDPTLGQLVADATHIKLVEGDLARQIEIMGVLGRLRFDLLEVGVREEPGQPG